MTIEEMRNQLAAMIDEWNQRYLDGKETRNALQFIRYHLPEAPAMQWAPEDHMENPYDMADRLIADMDAFGVFNDVKDAMAGEEGVQTLEGIVDLMQGSSW